MGAFYCLRTTLTTSTDTHRTVMRSFLVFNLFLSGILFSRFLTSDMEPVMTVGVDTINTRILLEEITQSAEPVRDRQSPLLEPDYYGCGSCLSRLRPGSTGTINNYGNSSCLWLLHAEDRRTEIQLVCRHINLPSCKSRASSGGLPSLDNVLLISPGWDLTKSWLYC